MQNYTQYIHCCPGDPVKLKIKIILRNKKDKNSWVAKDKEKHVQEKLWRLRNNKRGSETKSWNRVHFVIRNKKINETKCIIKTRLNTKNKKQIALRH